MFEAFRRADAWRHLFWKALLHAGHDEESLILADSERRAGPSEIPNSALRGSPSNRSHPALLLSTAGSQEVGPGWAAARAPLAVWAAPCEAALWR